MIKTRLLIARHGNTFGSNDVVRRVGITDLPLVESGLKQGRMLGTYLKYKQMIPDVIFTSTLKRTIQTAEQAQYEMQTALPMKALSIFNEIDYGVDENKPETQVIARIGADAMSAWETHAQVPNGWHINPDEIIQHWLDFASRLLNDYQGKTILVVTSNGIARFAPYLTGDFNAFKAQHGIKLSTGALAVFENDHTSSLWHCCQWNANCSK